MKLKLQFHHKLWIALLLVYLATHIFRLTSLPVFADESIYIRWAQLIIDDPVRYLFFPLNDGKTPLFIWTMVPLLKTFKDPLFAGRLSSVLVGILQIVLIASLTQKIYKDRSAALIAGLLASFLPFWFFHQRIALMDAMLSMWLLLTLWAAVSLSVHRHVSIVSINHLRYLLIIAISFAAAMWTKIPAILFVPAVIVSPLLVAKINKSKLPQLLQKICLLLLSIGVGLGLFFLLKLHPAFSQLFGRGGDFLYAPQEFINGGYAKALANQFSYIQALLIYLTPLGCFLPAIGLLGKKRRIHLILLLMSLSFMLPIMILGKVVYPRYLLPGMITLTISAAIVLADFAKFVLSQRQAKRRLMWSVSLALVIVNLVGPSTQFMFYAWIDPDHLLLTPIDRVQYLTEWSSGHGISQAVELIKSTAETQTVAVATEGFFGTLPDAINMYLHNADVSNIWVEGIGQPVREIRQDFADRAKDFDQQWLVVNSHRLMMSIDTERKLAEYCRPFNAPCLQVWDIKGL